VRVIKPTVIVAVILSCGWMLSMPQCVQAYIGPGAGLELVPHATALAVWVGIALLCILLWPLTVLVCWLRGARQRLAKTNARYASAPGPGAASPSQDGVTQPGR
jgi:hypothetical protein